LDFSRFSDSGRGHFIRWAHTLKPTNQPKQPVNWAAFSPAPHAACVTGRQHTCCRRQPHPTGRRQASSSHLRGRNFPASPPPSLRIGVGRGFRFGLDWFRHLVRNPACLFHGLILREQPVFVLGGFLIGAASVRRSKFLVISTCSCGFV
jgi:hypothetical protein